MDLEPNASFSIWSERLGSNILTELANKTFAKKFSNGPKISL